ncbi:HNH endonuclease signature motif containing protein [Paenibacillus cremeus]|nr:HNH endonuclease signature motif containing protein [Paenibacillus cremeus]
MENNQENKGKMKDDGRFKRKPIEFIIDDNGCFVCTSHYASSEESGGHIRYWFDKKVSVMHKFIYNELFGEVPEGLVVRHTCDNPKCINPEHLILGTQGDNVRDKVERNRQAKGEKVHTSKLTEEHVLEILKDKSSTNADLGRKYGVIADAISKIRLGITWKHVNRETV